MLMMAALGSFSLASAAPLLGSTAAFTNGPYCARNSCALTSIFPLTANLKMYEYRLKPQFEEMPAAIASVIRDKGKVISVTYRVGAQDGPFRADSDSHETRQAADLIEVATGKRPTNAWLSKVKCRDFMPEGVMPNMHQGSNRTYTVTCTTSPDRGFWWYLLTIY